MFGPLGVLPDGWKMVRLAEITTKIGSGATPRGGEAVYLEERKNFAFVRSQNVFDYYFDASEIRYIGDDHAAQLRGVHLEKNDILLNITGDGITFGRSCIVPEEVLPAAVNQHVSIVRLKKGVCLPGYLLAYLCHPKIKEYIASFNAGGSRRAITKGNIESFLIPLAPDKTQEVVQKIVFSLNNKIELNRQINHTLEQIAQTIFKSWFVDFEPVKAKIEAKAALTPTLSQREREIVVERAAMCAISGKSEAELDLLSTEQRQQLATTAALFPDALVESELGLIPEGWEVQRIKEIVKRYPVGEKYSQKTASETGSVPILDQGRSGVIGYHNNKPGVKASPDDPIIVFANHTCYMRLIMHDFSAIQNVLPFKGITLNIFWLYVAIFGKQEFVEYKGHWPDFEIKEIVIPSRQLSKIYGEYVREIFLDIFANEIQSVTLANLRDTLLPKLLSGELASTVDDSLSKEQERAL